MDSSFKQNWTLYFLIKADDSNIDIATELIKELLSLKISNLVSLVLCVKMNRKNFAKFIAGDAKNMFKDDPSPENTTFFLKMVPLADGQPGNNHLVDLHEDPDFDLTDPADLTFFFRFFSRQDLGFCRYLLLTWDHGIGYSMFYDVNVKNLIGISMGQLNQAIQDGFGGKKIEIILMVNCYMQVIDTGYALRESTRYLIASQLAMDLSGYNYTAIFQAVCNDPYIDSQKLAEIAISSYSYKKFPTRASEIFIKKKAEIFLLDLMYIEILVSYIKTLAFRLSESALYRRKIPVIVGKTLSIVITYHLIDFYSFIQLLGREGDQELDEYLNPILNIREKIIIGSFLGDNYTKGGQNNRPPSGISIFFPVNISFSNMILYDGKYFTETSFARDSKWTDFLKRVLPA